MVSDVQAAFAFAKSTGINLVIKNTGVSFHPPDRCIVRSNGFNSTITWDEALVQTPWHFGYAFHLGNLIVMQFSLNAVFIIYQTHQLQSVRAPVLARQISSQYTLSSAVL